MKRQTAPSACAFVVVLAAAAVAAPRPVGQLLDVQGGVQLRRAGQPARAAGLLDELQPGDTLTVRRGLAKVVLFRNEMCYSLADGAAVQVGPTGLRRLAGPPPQPLPSAPQPFARPLTAPRRPVPRKLLGVITRSGGEEPLGPRRPSPDGAVRQPPVTLRWEGPIEGDRLVLQVSDGERIVHRAELGPTVRAYQLSAEAVRPGLWYAWFVTATGAEDGPHKCHALLRVLPPSERAALEQEERLSTAAQASGTDRPAATMRLARLYERLGLFEQARTAYQAVKQLRPADPGVRAALARPRGADPP